MIRALKPIAITTNTIAEPDDISAKLISSTTDTVIATLAMVTAARRARSVLCLSRT